MPILPKPTIRTVLPALGGETTPPAVWDNLPELKVDYQEDLKAIAPASSPLNTRPAIYKDAQVAGQPIPVFAPNNTATEEVRLVTSELLEALGVSVRVESAMAI